MLGLPLDIKMVEEENNEDEEFSIRLGLAELLKKCEEMEKELDEVLRES